jgi:hypothetical protein
MQLPKQSIPVLRNLNSVSVSNYCGVNASLGRTELNRLFKRRGTCTCYRTKTGNFFSDPSTDNCNRGFTPKCYTDGSCRCKDSRYV